MDVNLVVISGRLVTPPDISIYDSGAVVARYLVTVKSEEPRKRIDVVPVHHWDPPTEVAAYRAGMRINAIGTVQRRFWDGTSGRRSRLEIVAGRVVARGLDECSLPGEEGPRISGPPSAASGDQDVQS